MNEEVTHKLFNLIERHPNRSQRQLAAEMRISLGKTNYCIRGLIERGWLKARMFKNGNNKIAYSYIVTPKGLGEKAEITARYLRRKLHEYESLRIEIEKLRQEVAGVCSESENSTVELDERRGSIG